MRVSAESWDRDYVGDKKFAVTLDGELVAGALCADDERGYVVRFKTDKNGNKKLNQARDGFQREQLFGVVTITEVDPNE
jgi:hypothetical protein